MREKFIRFMNGRNGMDELARAEYTYNCGKPRAAFRLCGACRIQNFMLQ